MAKMPVSTLRRGQAYAQRVLESVQTEFPELKFELENSSGTVEASVLNVIGDSIATPDVEKVRNHISLIPLDPPPVAEEKPATAAPTPVPAPAPAPAPKPVAAPTPAAPTAPGAPTPAK